MCGEHIPFDIITTSATTTALARVDTIHKFVHKVASKYVGQKANVPQLIRLTINASLLWVIDTMTATENSIVPCVPIRPRPWTAYWFLISVWAIITDHMSRNMSPVHLNDRYLSARPMYMWQITQYVRHLERVIGAVSSEERFSTGLATTAYHSTGQCRGIW